LRMNNKVRDD